MLYFVNRQSDLTKEIEGVIPHRTASCADRYKQSRITIQVLQAAKKNTANTVQPHMFHSNTGKYQTMKMLFDEKVWSN